jgi:hypothetical protein
MCDLARYLSISDNQQGQPILRQAVLTVTVTVLLMTPHLLTTPLRIVIVAVCWRRSAIFVGDEAPAQISSSESKEEEVIDRNRRASETGGRSLAELDGDNLQPALLVDPIFHHRHA